MSKILRKRLTILTFVTLCLILSAGCQLLIPYIISGGISKIADTDYIINLLRTLTLIFIAKGVLQGIADCLSAYIETTLRMDLIKYICENHKHTTYSAFMTRITEDAERIAAAILSSLYFLGSTLLALSTSYLLIVETPYFLLPLSIIWSLTAYQLKKHSSGTASRYKNEIIKEEQYKLSVLRLIEHFRSVSHNDIHARYSSHLNEAIAARYEYQKLNLLICFTPEFFIAITTVLIVVLVATVSPELFGSKYIYYLGYLGLFSMASRHSLEIALSLVGVNESVKRIFEGV
ncbi:MULTISPECIES: hypothetical protein [Pseudomonas]|uniref:hypothetical protein n=1 Tax=Pseudomonas TaxID=286 RepID=UPI001BE6739B|nr:MULTISPECIES: hypothetical protein [Pseudomonas]MBT2338127.1 ABC transporter ATP-binding protein [Pseudomonas fluorescens]MCD4527602.1 hypothetical protein [Pseudomonas sp. C3-2018]